MNMIRGFRSKLSAFCVPEKPMNIIVNINGNANYDFSFFGLSENDTLSKEDYMIFYNQLESPEKEMVLSLQKNHAQMTIDLNRLPSDINKITSAICIDGEGSMSQIQNASFRLSQNGEDMAILELQGIHFQNERAIIGLELYRKDAEWRINAIGKGFDGGLQALLESYGGMTAKTKPVSSQNKISLVKKLEHAPELISLAKPIQLTLEKYKIQDVVAKVAIVIDISGSMSERYRNGSVQLIIEKTLPLALQFDDNGQMDCWYFGSTCKKMEDVNLGNYKNAVPADWKKFMSYLGCSNNEPAVMQEVLDKFQSSTTPVYVLFISDGGVSKQKKIKDIIKKASQYPIFWQFMGVGGCNYGILEQLDTLTDRVVDNAGFFAIDDFREISSEEIYGRLLCEFPVWLEKAKALHIL